MAGNNDRIHGFNAVYRDASTGFECFESMYGRPQRFNNRPINTIGARSGVLDHQGHIVPQNILNVVLDPLMTDMAATCNNPADVADFIKRRNDMPWLQSVFNYGTSIKAPMFSFESTEPEDKVGNFFSIVTWNPVNICRAPDDTHRGGLPGDSIDAQVVGYLNQNGAAQNINQEWFASLQALQANPTDITNINNYITACSNTLAGQQQNGIGYYSFPWQGNGNAWAPNMAQGQVNLLENSGAQASGIGNPVRSLDQFSIPVNSRGSNPESIDTIAERTGVIPKQSSSSETQSNNQSSNRKI